MTIKFLVPGKVTSANRVTRRVGNVSVKSESAREDCSRIAARAIVAKQFARWITPDRARVSIKAYNSLIDADNLPKTILDGIKRILIVDDKPKHLRSLYVEHVQDDAGERYEVEVEAA